METKMANPFERMPGKKQEWKTCATCSGSGKDRAGGTCAGCGGSGKTPDR